MQTDKNYKDLAGFSVQNNKSATNYDNFANEREFGKLSHLSINPSTMEESSQLNTENFLIFRICAD